MTNKMNKALLFIFVVLPAVCCSGQTDTALGEIYDYLYGFQLQDNDEIESNEFLFENTLVNVNTASLQTLMQLPGMDYPTAARITDFRNRNGRFFSLTELLEIKGLDKALIRSMQPYLTLTEDIHRGTGIVKADSGRGAYFTKADIRSGLSVRQNSVAADYTGPAYRQYNKLRLTGENWKAALKTEKDPGEMEFADFKSFFVQIKNLGIINSFIAGDYYIEFGQGLSRWSQGRNLNSRGISFNSRSGRGVVPASGFNETGFLRGLSLELNYNTLYLTGFASSVSRDAEKDSAGNIVSFLNDGYHRTGLEISRKGNCRELTYGLLAKYTPNSKWAAEILLNRTGYNYPVKSSEPAASFFLASAAYSLNLSKLHINGEAAYEANRISISNTMGYELVYGLNLMLCQVSENWGNRLNYNTGSPLIGHYNLKEFQTSIRGEIPLGVFYLSYAYKSMKKPGGSEILSRESGVVYSGSFGKSFNGELKINLRNENSKMPGAVLSEDFKDILNIRADLRYMAGNNIFFHWRADYCRTPVNFLKKGENGIAFYNETKFQINKNIIILTRLTVYKTGSYDSRLYELEGDVSGTLYSSLLCGTGVSWYIITELSLWPDSKIAAKFADETKNIQQDMKGQLINNKRLSIQIEFGL